MTQIMRGVPAILAPSVRGVEAAATGERRGQEPVEAQAVEGGVHEREAGDLAGFQGKRRIHLAAADRDREYQALKHQILDLGWARPGSLIRRMPCGNPACRCMSRPPRLHGPYVQWSHKIGGKTRSLQLSEDPARMAKGWTDNYRKLKKGATPDGAPRASRN
jgi:hypothetical protein